MHDIISSTTFQLCFFIRPQNSHLYRPLPILTSRRFLFSQSLSDFYISQPRGTLNIQVEPYIDSAMGQVSFRRHFQTFFGDLKQYWQWVFCLYRTIFHQNESYSWVRYLCKVGYVFPMAIVSMLPYEESERNGHRVGTPHFIISNQVYESFLIEISNH